MPTKASAYGNGVLLIDIESDDAADALRKFNMIADAMMFAVSYDPGGDGMDLAFVEEVVKRIREAVVKEQSFLERLDMETAMALTRRKSEAINRRAGEPPAEGSRPGG